MSEGLHTRSVPAFAKAAAPDRPVSPAEQRAADIRRTVFGVAAAAASLLLFIASGFNFHWRLDAWLLAHGVLEVAIIVAFAHIVSISFGLWFGQRDPRWLVVCAAFLLATLLDLGHLLFYAGIATPAPNILSTRIFVWAHESAACVALLTAAFVLSAQQVRYRHAAAAIVLLALFVGALLWFQAPVEQLVRTAWQEKGNNFFNLLICLVALLRVSSRTAAGDRTPGLLTLGAVIGIEMTAQLSFMATRQYTDAFTTLGHAYKLIAFGVLYYGLFFANFLRPYELLRKTEALFRILVERSPAGITLSREGRIVHANDAFLQMFGFPDLRTAKSTRLWELDADDPRAAQKRYLAREEGDTTVPMSMIRRTTRHDGRVIHVRVEHEVVDMPDGRATLGYFVDLSDTINAQNELQRLANYDPLTGLPNRSLLLDRLDQAVRTAQRAGELVAVLFLDLDQFKGVNDTLGHSLGDELLKRVASRLGGVCRKEDTLGRLGGDEFLVIAQRLPNQDAAATLAGKLVNALERPFELDGHELYIGGSVGVSLFPRDAHDSGTMIKHADLAMYQAKQSGGPRVCFYSEDMNTRAVERLELGAELRRALEREEFELFYQPQVELSSGRVVAAEVLLRWRSPTRGLVLPENFVPVLEETGLISHVGRLVLAKACHQAMQWRTAGVGRVSVAVNISPAQFRSGQLAEDVELALQASGLPHEDLEMEITESLLFEDMEEARTLLERLTSRGVRVALDDFGTGYSSLSSLHNLPVHCVKIDRTFTLALLPGRNTIAAAIINVAHTLGMRVVAEGVETEQQRDILRELGCDDVQGYLVAQPMSGEECSAWLKDRRAPHLVPVGKRGEHGS